MTEIHRTSLEWARDIARIYRSALRAIAPEKCAELDEMAQAKGQRWIAPIFLPADAFDEGLDKVLSPKEIEQFCGVPAATIYGWASKGKLTNRGKKGEPKFLVSDVLAIGARHPKPA